MNLLSHRFGLLIIACACLILWVGCGGEDSTPSGTSQTPAASETVPTTPAAGETPTTSPRTALPTASIGTAGQPGSEKTPIAELAEGSAEWSVREITRLLVQPLSETDDSAQLREARRERNQRIVDLATQAIASAHNDGSKELIFNAAAHHLMTATSQLALQGDRESVDALYEHAAALSQRDPKSRAAAEAAYTLANFAYKNAERYAEKEPRWLEEFARQARLFAANFPDETDRAVKLLTTAGWSCELHGMIDDAIGCYAAIQEHAPHSPHAERVAGPLRRLNLLGKPLELAGPTINGGFRSIDDYRDKTVLVVFWSTIAKPFMQQFSSLKAVVAKHDRLAVLTVNLDQDETAVGQFREQHAVDWPIVFHSDPEKRGWNNPVAAYYGIRNVPAYWLVAPDGTVVSMSTGVDQLESDLQKALSP